MKYLLLALLLAQTTLDRALTIQGQVNALVASLSTVIVDVPTGGNAQAALDAAAAGTVIRLTAGASYPGTLTLRTSGVTITTTASLPIGRISPAQAALLPKVQNILTVAGVHDVSLVGLEVTNSGSDLIRLGDGSSAQNTLTGVPFNLTVDRCYIHGDATLGAKRGIALNSGQTTIRESYISDIKVVGQDSQAIAGWNGPGPYLITNNYLEGAAENVLFGGADPAIPNLVPSDITVTNNTINKPTTWRGQGWSIKNLFELKNARRVTVDGNTLTNSWGQAQVGYAFVLTPRNQDGTCPWCTVEDVTISNNTISHVAAGFDLQGADDPPRVSGRMARVNIHHNLLTDVDPWAYAGSDKLYLILSGPVDVTFDHNIATGQHIGSVVSFDGTPKSLRLAVTNNTWPPSLYGIKGSGTASGQASWDAYVDSGVLSGNVIQ